ncbi:TrmB family transcriptional regulator [Halomarina halobia]|uniref:TrmB family transcriptional regulator n=1 Tax=Halomarina halobia TaxID=3033386 RepID=A0ABD6ADF5_9EURY|nr:helix-turn-helix domain-containing protein [Halomarina sp. PSR21]
MASLCDLGLSTYEAQAYRGLVEHGQATAPALADLTDVPEGRIYDVLNSLAQREIVQVWDEHRPKRYTAVPPAIALDRLLTAKRDELETQAEQYEATIRDVAADFNALDPVDSPSYPALIGFEQSTERLIETLSTAQQAIYLALPAQVPGLSSDEARRFGEALSAVVERGVPVSLLLHPESTLQDETFWPVPEQQPYIHCQYSEAVSTLLACLDMKHLFIALPLSHDQAYRLLSIDVTETPLPTTLVDAFTDLEEPQLSP